jgi:type II secretory pathway component PulF
MPNYSYKAMDSTGQRVAGSLPAANRVAALDLLGQQGLLPVSVLEQASAAPAVVRSAAPKGGRVSQAMAESFVRELSSLLAAGVPLGRSLHILGREASNPHAKAQWMAIHEDVVGGMSLAEAMGRWPRTFSPVQVAMVRAGEMGGFLDVVLSQIAEFRARERDLKGRLKGAMIYPAVLTVLAVAVVIFLMTFFIPTFSGIFGDLGADLPALTQGIVAVSNAMTHHGLLVLAVLAAGGYVGYRWMGTDAGRRTFERWLLRIPALGTVLARFALVRFCRMLGTLLGAGVPLVGALKVARQAIGNQTLSDAVGQSVEEVQRGASLARSLGACPALFPSSVTEVIAVAEESGRLDQELNRLANTHEAELDRRLRMLVALAEPIMLFVMAAFVGTIVIGMLLPLFTLYEHVK